MTEEKGVVLSASEISFAKPVETPFGKMRFLTYDEYLSLDSHLGWVAQNVLHIYYMIRNTIPKHEKEELKALKTMKEHSLRELVLTYPQIINSYQIVLGHMLDINDYGKELETFIPVLADIMSNDESFLLMRDYIMKMNLLREDKVSPNHKIQELFERDRKINKERYKNSPESTDIVFSVASLTPNSLESIRQMSPLQVHNLYARVSADKDYERNISYAIAGADIEIESWAKKIDLFEIKDTSISKAEFDQRNAGMFKQ